MLQPELDSLLAKLEFELLALVGTVWSPLGRTPKGVDCAGVMTVAAERAGLEAPDSSSLTFRDIVSYFEDFAERVDSSDIQPGDVLVFQAGRGGPTTHMGMAISGERMIHSIEPKKGFPHRGKVIESSWRAKPLFEAIRVVYRLPQLRRNP